MMYEKKVKVGLEGGLGGEEATKVVQEAAKYRSAIFLQKLNSESPKPMNAKDVMGLMALDVHQNDGIVISAEGADRELAVDSIASILSQQN